MDSALARIPLFLGADDAAFRRRLHEQGFEIFEIAMDGNCFYSAISQEIFGTTRNQHQVRYEVQQYILNHLDEFIQFYERIGAFDIREEALRITNLGEWADQPSIVAASHAFEINIVILQPSGSPINHPADLRYPRTVHLSYHNQSHYNLLIRPQNNAESRHVSGPSLELHIPGAKRLKLEDSPSESTPRGREPSNAGPLDIFPVEIWERILDNIESPVDRAITQLALPELGDALQYRTPKWLMLSVLPIISRYLSLADILSMRLVCKIWNKSLNMLIEQHPYFEPYNEDHHNGLRVSTSFTNRACPLFGLATSNPVLHFRNAEAVGEFLAQYDQSSSGGGVFGRTVMLNPLPLLNSENAVNPMPIFNSLTMQMLSRCGLQIRNLILTSHNEIESPIGFYYRLCSILKMTPRLRSLSILLPNQNDTSSLSKGLLERQMPPLKYLKFLRFVQDTTRGPKDILDDLLLYAKCEGSQVRKLVLSTLPRNFSMGYKLRFSNLLDLEICSWGESPAPRLQLNGSMVQRLIDHDATDISDSLDRILLLNLRVFHTRVTRIDENWIFHMPNVHTMRFCDSSEINYNFLLACPLLIRLEIIQNQNDRPQSMAQALSNLTESQRSDRNENFDLTAEFRHRIYNTALITTSFIWDLLPGLDRILIASLNHNGELVWSMFSRHR